MATNPTKFNHSDSWWNASAVCPFYGRVRTAYREIVCEAVTNRAAVSVLRFRNAKSMEGYLEAYCSDIDKCRLCRNHRMAAEKYDEQGNLREEDA